MSGHFSLLNRTAVITGAVGQLGSHCSKAYVEQGAHIVAVDVLDPSHEKVHRLIETLGQENVLYCKADITSRSDLETALGSAHNRWGTPGILVNNAALDSPPGSPAADNGPFESYPESSWDQVMSVNVKGVFIACQVFGGAMAKEGIGTIINISSIYGLVSPNQDIYEYRRQRGESFYKPVAYSASKSALFNLTRYLATYWGRAGVRVNTLTLAGIFNNQDKEFLSEYCRRIPIGRMANPEEYMGALIFLASEASRYMTGSNMVVDGGWTAW